MCYILGVDIIIVDLDLVEQVPVGLKAKGCIMKCCRHYSVCNFLCLQISRPKYAEHLMHPHHSHVVEKCTKLL